MFGSHEILSIYIKSNMNCLVLMPFIFILFLLDSSLYIASRSSLSQCHLAHEFTVTSYFFRSIMQISGSPLTPMYLSQLTSHSSYRVFYSNKGSNFLSSSPYLFSYNSLYFHPSNQSLHFFQS